MQVNKQVINPTKVKLQIKGDTTELDSVYKNVLKTLASGVKVDGFRAGKVPANIAEKHIDQTALQTEFLDSAVNSLFYQAVIETKVRVVSQPQITISKFVPFDTLEFDAEVEIIGEVKLADYKTLSMSEKKAKITADEVNKILDDLAERAGDKKPVKRAAKLGDQVVIDFAGRDAKDDTSIDGTDGEDYPLTLGSNSFIPGFEEELIGLSSGEEKDFPITFPGDYGAKTLANKKVKFKVTVKDVNELVKSKIDDEFAAKVGPFKNLGELKDNVKEQLAAERQRELDREFNNELIDKLASKSEVAIPDSLIDQEIVNAEEEEKRNLVYRGMTWEDHLKSEGITEKQHRERDREKAVQRVKAGLILGEVADIENIQVTDDELKSNVAALKGRYNDQKMREELDKPDNQQELKSRITAEKTLETLRTIAIANNKTKAAK